MFGERLTKEQEEQCFSKGQLAYSMKQDVLANPYPNGSQRWYKWRRGCVAASLMAARNRVKSFDKPE